jgi:hypothetical protein
VMGGKGMERIEEMMKSDEMEKERRTPPELGGVADMGIERNGSPSVGWGWRWGW